jgi:hypothetical protein
MESDGRPAKKSTSPWVWVGCGCGVAVLLALAGMAGLTWWGYRQAKEIGETMANPEKRAAKVQEVLAYKELPAGYYPAFSFSAPFGVMEMAVLSDHEPSVNSQRSPETRTRGRRDVDYDPDFNERGFVYMNMRDFQNNREKMRRFLRGEAPLPKDSPWVQSNVSFDSTQVIRRGALEGNGQQILYTATRGEVSRRGHRHEEGIVTMVMPQCPDNRLHLGLWFGPDPTPDKPVDEADYTGTSADPAAIQEFLGHFGLCGGSR